MTMKIIAIILSIYTITLSALPCDDEYEFSSGELTSVITSTDCDGHSFYDNCSPFCSCICCSVVPKSNKELDLEMNPYDKHCEMNIVYFDFYSNSCFSRILQPPQV